MSGLPPSTETAVALQAAFLAYLAGERRAAVKTIETYGGDLAELIGFLTLHIGSEPTGADLAAVSLADLRAYLARVATKGAGNANSGKSTGAGKGIGAVIPNLLGYPGSAFVLDFKGENFAVTARARRELGQLVVLVDPFGITG